MPVLPAYRLKTWTDEVVGNVAALVCDVMLRMAPWALDPASVPFRLR